MKAAADRARPVAVRLRGAGAVAVVVVAALAAGGCMTINCNVKDACRPATAGGATSSPDR